MFIILDSTPTIPTATSFLPLTTTIKDLTQKWQTSSIISSIPLFETINVSPSIHTDSTSIIDAEEATESPKMLSPNSCNIEDDEKLKIFDKIAQQDFDDTILFKHKRCRKRSDVAASELSCSSNSSEERESNISKPTLMAVSTVGVLPDLRSPERIMSDIEDKEKMLADILCFDRVKISPKGMENCCSEEGTSEHIQVICLMILENYCTKVLIRTVTLKTSD